MKIVTARQAADLIPDGATVSVSGFGGFCHPEAVTAAAEERFKATGRPRNLDLFFAGANGDRDRRGMSHFGHEGMVRRVIAGGWRASPLLGDLALAEKIQGYNYPQGVMAQLYRAAASGQPGVITKVGLGTFIDPRIEGGRINETSPPGLVELIEVKGAEYLFYPAPKIDVAILRGTTADSRGNIALEDEAFPLDVLAMAQAARNAGGIVIVQVKRVDTSGHLDPNLVRIPGILVTYVVVCEDPAQHWLNYAEIDNPTYNGQARAPASHFAPTRLDMAKIIQRRAFLELAPLEQPVVNLGIGYPAGLGQIAAEEGKTDMTLTVESGVIGGVMAEELSFGAAINPEAIIPESAQFDFYDGGGLDIAFLGMAEFDTEGNVNVSRFGDRVVGVGGFVNIAQNARRLAFLGTLSAKGLSVEVTEAGIRIAKEGAIPKLVDKVRQISFSAAQAEHQGQPVLYITERAVFQRRNGKLAVVEIAPGIDAEKDLKPLLPHGVAIAADCKPMDLRIFSESAMRDGAA